MAYKTEKLLVVTLIVATYAAQPTITFSYTLSPIELKRVADEIASARKMAKIMIYGDQVSEETKPLDCVEATISRMADFTTDQDFDAASKQTVEQLKLKMEETDQKVEIFLMNAEKEILALQKAIKGVLKYKDSMSDGSHLVEASEREEINNISKYIDDLEKNAARLDSILSEYLGDKGRSLFNARKKGDNLQAWQDIVDFYSSEANIFVPYFESSTISAIEESARKLDDIRSTIRIAIINRQENSFWFIRWWWNDNAKLADEIYPHMGKPLPPASKLIELDRQSKTLRSDYKKFVDETTKQLPETLEKKFQALKSELEVDVKNIKTAMQKINITSDDSDQLKNRLGKWLHKLLGDFVQNLDGSLNDGSFLWFTMNKRIAELARILLFNDDYFKAQTDTIKMDKIEVVIGEGQVNQYPKQLTFIDHKCNLYSSYFYSDKKDSALHKITGIIGQAYKYQDGKFPFTREQLTDNNWESTFKAKISENFVTYVSELAAKDQQFKEIRCSLYLLGGNGTRLDIDLISENDNEFKIRREDGTRRLVLVV